MYQVCVWDHTIWNEKIIPQIFTSEAEAVLLAVQRSHTFLRTMYGVIEDGNDVPVAMIYGGEIFPRKPSGSEKYTIDETDQWIEDYERYTGKRLIPITLEADDGLRLCKICKARYATRGDGVCRICHDQWIIDQM